MTSPDRGGGRLLASVGVLLSLACIEPRRMGEDGGLVDSGPPGESDARAQMGGSPPADARAATAAPDAADAAGPGTCAPAARRCGPNQTPEVCSPAGAWMPVKIPCEFVCTGDGECGECRPASRRCGAGNTPEVCSINGRWERAAQACEFVCAGEGQCGECRPGTQNCLGLQPQMCDLNGRWQAGTACPFVCMAGACLGTCKPGAQRCSGNTPQMCDETGTYRNLTPCPFVCTGDGSCGGACRPNTTTCNGTRREICDGSGRLRTEDCSAPRNADPTCSGDGTCGFSCRNPFVRNGNACGCSNGRVECNNSCQECCGGDASNCENRPNLERLCSGNRCSHRPACDLSGPAWTSVSNSACPQSQWIFTATSADRTSWSAQEIGCAGATGTATYDGTEIVLRFTFAPDDAGIYRWKVNGDCRSGGQGVLEFTRGFFSGMGPFTTTLTR